MQPPPPGPSRRSSLAVEMSGANPMHKSAVRRVDGLTNKIKLKRVLPQRVLNTVSTNTTQDRDRGTNLQKRIQAKSFGRDRTGLQARAIWV